MSEAEEPNFWSEVCSMPEVVGSTAIGTMTIFYGFQISHSFGLAAFGLAIFAGGLGWGAFTVKQNWQTLIDRYNHNQRLRKWASFADQVRSLRDKARRLDTKTALTTMDDIRDCYKKYKDELAHKDFAKTLFVNMVPLFQNCLNMMERHIQLIRSERFEDAQTLILKIESNLKELDRYFDIEYNSHASFKEADNHLDNFAVELEVREKMKEREQKYGVRKDFE